MKKWFLVALFITIFTKGYSQNEFSVHAGPAIPTSDFANDDVNRDDTGGAALGFDVGIDFKHTLSSKGIFLFASADYMNNGLTSKAKNEFNDGVSDITFLKYTNIPIIAGLGLELRTSKSVHTFASIGAGVNFLNISDMVFKRNGLSATTFFDQSNELAYKLSAGFIIKKRVTLSINSINLGTHEILSRMVAPNGDKTTEKSPPLKVSMLTLTVGVKF